MKCARENTNRSFAASDRSFITELLFSARPHTQLTLKCDLSMQVSKYSRVCTDWDEHIQCPILSQDSGDSEAFCVGIKYTCLREFAPLGVSRDRDDRSFISNQPSVSLWPRFQTPHLPFSPGYRTYSHHVQLGNGHRKLH